VPKFEKGHPGGPGRPLGSRNVANRRLDEIAMESAEATVRAMAKAAAEGNCVAARLVLNRVWSVPKGRAPTIDLPEIHTPQDLVRAHGFVAQAVAEGAITAQDAESLSSMLEAHRRTFELVEQHETVAQLQAEVLAFKKLIGRA
jgi:hypothetical protein